MGGFFGLAVVEFGKESIEAVPIVAPAPKEGNIILIGSSPMVEEFAGRLLTEENVGYDGFQLSFKKAKRLL